MRLEQNLTRIAYITAGAGSMYCGACARDLVLMKHLLAAGVDARMIPLYTPLRTDSDEQIPAAQTFYGGLTVCLRQSVPLLRRIPSSLLRFLDNPGLLKWISRFAISVDPAAMGPMTVSVLAGAEGKQYHELRSLLDYLTDMKPDVVSLTNSLLSGIAPHVKAAGGRAVVCTFQGEDSFVAALPQPYRSQAIELIRRHAKSIDLFIAPCQACADAMAGWLGVEAARIRVIRTGIDPALYRPRDPSRRDIFTVGYLSAIRPAKGLDLLIEAMVELISCRHRPVRLVMAGQVLDAKYWRGIQRRIRSAGLEAHCRYLGELDFSQKTRMLGDCDVFVQPSRIDDWRAVAAIEAMACAVPVIAPKRGAFPELLSRGGGIVYHNEEAMDLVNAIERLVENPQLATDMGQAARLTIQQDYTAATMAEQTIAVYRQFGK